MGFPALITAFAPLLVGGTLLYFISIGGGGIGLLLAKQSWYVWAFLLVILLLWLRKK